MDRRCFMQAAATLPVAAAAAGVEAATMETASAPDYLDLVTGLITDWRRKDAAAVLARVTDDIAWHTHVGSPPVLGKPAMQQTLDTLAAQMNDVKWRIFSCAQHGNRFFAEGVDDFVTAEGRRVVIPYAGILVFRGKLICEWRDYFDRALFNKLKAGEPVPDYVEALTTRAALF